MNKLDLALNNLQVYALMYNVTSQPSNKLGSLNLIW